MQCHCRHWQLHEHDSTVHLHISNKRSRGSLQTLAMDEWCVCFGLHNTSATCTSSLHKGYDMSAASCNATSDLAAVRQTSASFACLLLRPLRSKGLDVLHVVSTIAVCPARSSYQPRIRCKHTVLQTCCQTRDTYCVYYRIRVEGACGYLVWSACIHCHVTCQLRFKHSLL